MIEKPEVREYVRNYQIHEGKSFRESFSREIPDDGFDLLMGLLAFNPNNRLSAQVSKIEELSCRKHYSIVSLMI